MFVILLEKKFIITSEVFKLNLYKKKIYKKVRVKYNFLNKIKFPLITSADTQRPRERGRLAFAYPPPV